MKNNIADVICLRMKKIYLLLVILPLFLSSLTVLLPNTDNKLDVITVRASQYPDDPIEITGDVDFENQALSKGWTGDGSVDDPYLIGNYSISTTGNAGIKINGTRAHFIIQNVTVTGADYNGGAGAIELHDVVNGKLVENNATDSWFGFWIRSSSNVTLNKNNASDNWIGFHLYNSSNITLSGNNATNNDDRGFRLAYSSNNTLIGNTAKNNVDGGIAVEYSSNFNTVQDNTLINNILFFYGDPLYYIQQTAVTGNTLNDLPILYLYNATDDVYDTDQYGQIILVNCTAVEIANHRSTEHIFTAYCINILIRNITISKIYGEIFFLYMNDSAVLNNIASGCGDNGFSIRYSSGNTISNNTAVDNGGRGFTFSTSGNNTVNNNTALRNGFEGITTSGNSDFNKFINNTVLDNDRDGFAIQGSSSNNSVINNMIRDNGRYGIFMNGISQNNTFMFNNITSNSDYGFYIDDNTGPPDPQRDSINNLIYLNSFINNNGGNTQGYSEVSKNNWSNGTHGNYWSDYTGVDSDGDGIGDSTYHLDEYGVDNHPLMSQPDYSVSEFLDNFSRITIILTIISITIIAGKIRKT